MSVPIISISPPLSITTSITVVVSSPGLAIRRIVSFPSRGSLVPAPLSSVFSNRLDISLGPILRDRGFVPFRSPMTIVFLSVSVVSSGTVTTVVVMVVPIFPILFLLTLAVLPQGALYFLLLLLDQEPLHRIIFVVLFDQLGQLPLLPNHGPPLLFSLAALLHLHIHVLAIGGPLAAHDVLPRDLELLGVLVVAHLVAGVVDAHEAAADLGAAQVVDGQVGAPLVLVLEPAEALALARLLVPRQLQEHGLPVLREDGDDVALRQLVRQAAEVDEGGVAVVGVPGGFG